MNPPRVFVSYSHDSQTHKKWTLKLATDLRTFGIESVIDQWDLSPGQDLVSFIVKGITSADRVVLVCTADYIDRANGGSGGVGYESLVVTGQLVESIATNKFIPVVRDNPAKTLPTYLGPRLYIDFTDDSDYKAKLDELVREIHGAPADVKPPLGANPFVGTAPAPTLPARAAGPSGLTAGGQGVLDDAWFAAHEQRARTGIGRLALSGSMELRFALHDPINKSQIELMDAVRRSEIRTFGWPIGIVLERQDDLRPKPVADGVVAEVSISDVMIFGRPSYDFWALRNIGDFYLLQSLFEDDRATRAVFFDTRIVRVTESLMFCGNLYDNLGVKLDAPLSLRVKHAGLKDRVLTAASSGRPIIPASTIEEASEATLHTSVRALRDRLVDNVIQVLRPLFMLFEFKDFNRQVYEEIVNGFASGRVS